MEPSYNKVKFSSLSPDSLQQFKNQAMNLHDIAMGYVSRPVEESQKQRSNSTGHEGIPCATRVARLFSVSDSKNKMARSDWFS